jgi:hypothetical protein
MAKQKTVKILNPTQPEAHWLILISELVEALYGDKKWKR